MQSITDDEAEVFVLEMWMMLIFEINLMFDGFTTFINFLTTHFINFIKIYVKI